MAAPFYLRFPTLVAVCLVATAGCQVLRHDPYSHEESALGETPPPTRRSGSTLAASDSSPRGIPENRPDATTKRATAADNPADTNPADTDRLAEYEVAMQEVLAELAEIRAIDPAAQESLMNDLRESDPAMWPILVRQFRSTLQFVRQRETRSESDPRLASDHPAVQLPARSPTATAAHRIAAKRLEANPFPQDPDEVLERTTDRSREALDPVLPDRHLAADFVPRDLEPRRDQIPQDHRAIVAQASVGDLAEPVRQATDPATGDRRVGSAAVALNETETWQEETPAMDALQSEPRHQSVAADSTHARHDRTAAMAIDRYVTQVNHQRPIADDRAHGEYPTRDESTDDPLDIGLAFGVSDSQQSESLPSAHRQRDEPLASGGRQEPRPAAGPAAGEQRPVNQLAARPVSVASREPALSWAQHLNRAISQLEELVIDEPRTEEEARQQALLRMLYVVAGREEQALRPIAGVPHKQQDYWSTQMQALTTYLDDQTEQDLRERATEAYNHLVDATQLMGEMGKLSIDNLAFCSSVSSFGVYEAVTANEFAPGDRVLLYAEVSNYLSEPTADGFRTILASSYQILDERGNRVDSGEFPEVEDPCRNRRRDFHIQYGVELPQRIYADRYRLELLIEDRLSGKIGRASIYFDIVDRAGS